jgi:pyruvate,water dikinase
MITIPLSSTDATIENAGGKGASLARLANLGMPVPPGFILTTEAYRRFCAANHLEQVIRAGIAGARAEEMEALEGASAKIREAFSAGEIPAEMREAVRREYWALGESTAVAVRSSATTEDLPDLSFAGQQDTFLNVRGEVGLDEAIINCWSSLWTARAIGYRARNAIPHEQAALAVIVQEMVASEVSGVLFTANPVSGLLSEAVIDATFGLGEALVSGQVEPDHFVADSSTGQVRSVTLGSKKSATRPKPGGGVETVPEDASARQTLTTGQISALVEAGRKIQEAYGNPQDIEWALAGGALSILQSRPITSLFPVPRVSFDPLLTWFSFGAFQGIVGPLTPLGQEDIQHVVLGVGKKLGTRVTFEEQQAIEVAGERLWMNVSGLIRNSLSARILTGFLNIGEPTAASILKQIMTDPRLGSAQEKMRPGTLLRVLRFMLPGLMEIPLAVFRPEKVRERFDASLEEYLETVRIPAGSDRFDRLAKIAVFMGEQGGLAGALPHLLPRFAPIMAPSFAFLGIIGKLIHHDGKQEAGFSMSVLDVTRGLPRNVTVEMDLMLWNVSRVIWGDPASAGAFANNDAATLARQYLEERLPNAAQYALRGFMELYGMRGTGEVDLGQTRWREDPTPIILTLQSYLQIKKEDSPPRRHAQNVEAALQAIERMAGEVRKQHGGRLKEKILRGAARRVRFLLGARESPKFLAVRAMGIVRNALLEAGEEFAAAGAIQRREDMFFLHVRELEELARGVTKDWRGLVAERRQAYARELRRRQVPRILLSDGRAFYEGIGTEADSAQVIHGNPVSPGVVEGRVRVVFDPHHSQLAAGEIMVCQGTDPAWTPLFMAASGVIMEVGGMMTHGAVVAREYGIPAVVGVHQATQRLKDGQRIRLDGSNGRIVLLDGEE